MVVSGRVARLRRGREPREGELDLPSCSAPFRDAPFRAIGFREGREEDAVAREGRRAGSKLLAIS